MNTDVHELFCMCQLSRTKLSRVRYVRFPLMWLTHSFRLIWRSPLKGEVFFVSFFADPDAAEAEAAAAANARFSSASSF
jgi:hypothetical protein